MLHSFTTDTGRGSKVEPDKGPSADLTAPTQTDSYVFYLRSLSAESSLRLGCSRLHCLQIDYHDESSSECRCRLSFFYQLLPNCIQCCFVRLGVSGISWMGWGHPLHQGLREPPEGVADQRYHSHTGTALKPKCPVDRRPSRQCADGEKLLQASKSNRGHAMHGYCRSCSSRGHSGGLRSPPSHRSLTLSQAPGSVTCLATQRGELGSAIMPVRSCEDGMQ